jgi:3-phenylpropionate/trans-cinnamate dioxygenase ferredoxin subunit
VIEASIRLAEVPIGGLVRVVVGDRAVCVARLADGTLFAVDDACSHEDASLSEGELLGREVECPMHMSRFDVATGQPVSPPALLPIRTYAVRIQDGVVVVSDDA